MAIIQFKAKIQSVWRPEGDAIAWRYVAVPVLTRKHCDMPSFRQHAKLGGIANSDMFPNALSRIRRDIGETIRLDKLPANVTVDDSGFLATISIEV
jgi:hypothetical protein